MHVCAHYSYMHITAEGTPRGPLLIALVKPHGALSSDRVGALTKQILQSHRVDVTQYKPHTTRGDGKFIHKQINLPPDISCELRSWADDEVYCKYYNRLGALDTAATALNAHLAPSPSCATEALLHTPPSEQAGGRSKGNRAAQDGVGPTPQPKARPKPTKVPMLCGWR